jgi:hypothetical protein
MPKNLHSSKNKGKYRRYHDQMRRIKNKASKIRRHLKNTGQAKDGSYKDKVAAKALQRIK